MRRFLLFSTALGCLTLSLLALGTVKRANAHCEVPCGVYDDHARIVAILEDTTTIGRAVEKITGLAGKTDVQSLNQITRWVSTKEEHATRIQHVVAQYFLTQRVKAAEPGSDGYHAYLQQLAEHHAVMVAAMKAKQSATPASVDALRAAIEVIAPYYPAPAAQPATAPAGDHGHDHGEHGHDHGDHGHEHR